MSRSLVPSHSLFGGLDDFFSTPFMTDTITVPFMTNFDRQADMVLRRSSPCYEITEDENQFQLAVDVPGVKANDIDVQAEHGGRVLRLSGGRKVKRGNMVSESKFEKSFTLDRSIDASKISANLADGVLVIKAPKHEKHKQVQKISITEAPHETGNVEVGEAQKA